MATDVTIHLDDNPGELARVGEYLGDRGVNIEGLCTVVRGGGRTEVHLLVEDMTAAFEALAEGGIAIVSEQEVAVVPVEDRPGVLGEISHKLGAAGVNINIAYLATDTRLAIGADNLAEAKAALVSSARHQGGADPSTAASVDTVREIAT